ncbi:MAG: hypothetical protein ACLSD8_07570 [[Ruminococcus] torques]|uniref:hypothetical protein n=1 Tax=[Ruminococcus] torques TaxID=33039 RepID=UPI003995D5AA
MICQKAIQLSWHEASHAVATEMSALLHKKIDCRAFLDDEIYWAVSLENERLSFEELLFLIRSVGNQQEVIEENIDGDEAIDLSSIGTMLSEELLRKSLGIRWQQTLATEKHLTLVGVTEEKPSVSPIITIDGCTIQTDLLKSKDELLAFFEKNGATHTSLMDFCEEYRTQYQNELCWAYPISDGKHLGTYLILVREGILSLPYDEATEEDYEIFCVDEMRMFDAPTMKCFMEDWKTFSDDLFNAMSNMKKFLSKQEGWL